MYAEGRGLDWCLVSKSGLCLKYVINRSNSLWET